MSNEYFQPGAVPAPNAPGSSATIRGEFGSVAAGFDKLPALAGNADKLVAVDEFGTRLITANFNLSDVVNLAGVQELTNKTISWADNTFPGFGNAATRDAGLLAGNVLLLSVSNQLPAIDGSLLTNLNFASVGGVIPIANGGTGETTLPAAQTTLGIDLKANINSPSLTGTPTAPTPGVGDSSARIATTFFVTNTLNSIGAVSPGNALPLMDGVASAGTPGTFIVSRQDHVHPTDTSRAPASAATAAGTSLTPVGGVAATNVQAAVQELDSEKAPLASPTFTGTPSAPTPAPMDTSTRLATTAWVQTTLAALPPAGMYPDNDIPAMNGVGSAGTNAEASRGDHVHPSDTTKANLVSPVFTGNPVAPTPTAGDSSGSLATTAFVAASYVNKAGSTMTGALAAPQVQVGTSLTTSENHFFDGSVADQLSLKRGTPAAPGAELIKAVSGGLELAGRKNGTPSAGQIGEVIQFTAFSPAPTSGSFATIGSAALTVGVWLLFGTMSYTITTGPCQMRSCGFGVTGTTMDYGNALEQYATNGGFQGGMLIPLRAIVLNAAQTIYAVGRATFTGGSIVLASSCFAVRIG